MLSVYAALNTTLSLPKDLLPTRSRLVCFSTSVLSGRGMCACSSANPGSLGIFSAPCYGRTIGSSASLYDAYIVFPCSPDIFSEFQLPKGWSSASLCTIGQGSWGRSPKSFIPSVCSHRIHHKAPHPGKPLSVLPVSFALPLDIICLFHKGCTWWATNLVLSRHTLDNDCSSLLAVFTWTLHKHHRKSSTAIHIDSLYNMTLRRRYIYYINTHFKLLQLKTTGCSKTSLLIIKENSSQS